MKKTFWKRTAAAALALTLLSGAAPKLPEGFSLLRPAVTACAEDSANTFDTETGTLTLNTIEKGTDGSLLLPEGVTKSDVLYIKATDSATLPTDCSKLFNSFTAVKSIELWCAHAPEETLTSTAWMFGNCSSLEELSLGNALLRSGITNMSYMFVNCQNLKTLDLSCMDLSAVKDLSYMFAQCQNLQSVRFPSDENGKTPALTSMEDMFYNCCSLTAVDLTSLSTFNVTNMRNMFGNCRSLKLLDLRSFDTSALTNAGSMFCSCDKLQTIVVSDKWDLSNYTNNESMFNDNTALVGGNGTVFDTSKASDEYARIDTADAPGYFTQAGTVTVSGGIMTLSGVISEADVRAKCSADVTKVVCDPNTVFPVDSSHLFNSFTKVTEMDLSNADTSYVEDMFAMFIDCNALTALDLSGWDTGNVANMCSMFERCKKLAALDLSGWDTGNVTIMGNMFCTCTALTALDLSGWDTGNVENMNGMFFQCGSLETLDLSGWDTRNVKDMNGMFNLCGSLETLDLSGWDTRNVKDMSVMFYNCESLGSLDLSGWDTRNVQTMYQMFFNCTQLAMLDLSSFDIQNVDSLNSIFYSCQNLTDENVIIDSTKWDLEHVMNKSDMYTGSGLSGDVSKFTQTKLKSVNLVLQDDLGLNFYVDGITDDADAENYKIVFKGECDEKGKEISLQKKTVGDQNYYYATANVSADHMDERIAAVLYKKDGKGGWERVCGNNYTVNRYLDSTPAVKEALTNEMQKVTYENLASAVRLYGEVSYAYFHDETQFTTNPPDLPEVPEPPSAIDYEPDFKNGLDDKLTLVLNSKLSARLYIKDLKVGATAQCDGETLTAFATSKGVCFEIKELNPLMLGKRFTITYADYDYKFLPLSWAYRVMRSASADAKNIAMATALKKYYNEATSYNTVFNGRKV